MPGASVMVGDDERIVIAARCRDADAIAKVPDAGAVRQEAGVTVQVMHNGLKVLADGYCGAWMTQLIQTCQGHHEPQEERLFHAVLPHLPADGAMLELGGYWAFYSLWFLDGYPQRRAFVLEPDPAHMAVGRRNAALNGLSPRFIDGFAGPTPLPPGPFQTEQSGVVQTPCHAVPQIMRDHGLERLALLHCDAQGVELDVLDSCEALFRAGRIGWVFVSTHSHHITGDALMHQRCLARLRQFGAVIEAEHDVHESFSGDGLIVARFGPPPPGWGRVPLSRNRYSESVFRNPLHDLAETLHRTPQRAQHEATARALFGAILLREMQPQEVRMFADQLEAGTAMADILRIIFSSTEFQSRRADFDRLYGSAAPI